MGQPGGSTEVLADDVRLTALGQQFVTWSQEIDLLIPGIATARITPGHLLNAVALKTRFTERVQTEYKAVLEELRDSLYKTGSELVRIAQVYADTENLNREDLARLDGLVRSVGAIYPGLNSGRQNAIDSLLDELRGG